MFTDEKSSILNDKHNRAEYRRLRRHFRAKCRTILFGGLSVITVFLFVTGSLSTVFGVHRTKRNAEELSPFEQITWKDKGMR